VFVQPSFVCVQVTISNISIQQQKTQIGDICFDNSKSIKLKLAVKYKNLLLLFCRLKCYILIDNSSIYNISINTNRLLFVSTKLSKLSFKKIKIIYNIELQTLYYKFIVLNQTESAIIVFDSKSELFVIKKYKQNFSFYIQSVCFKVKSNCIIFIIETYTTVVDIYLVYKYIDIVLQYILITSRDQLVLHKIATVCREIYWFSIDFGI